jgi:propanediol dehydratase small subunit
MLASQTTSVSHRRRWFIAWPAQVTQLSSMHPRPFPDETQTQTIQQLTVRSRCTGGVFSNKLFVFECALKNQKNDPQQNKGRDGMNLCFTPATILTDLPDKIRIMLW